MKTKKLSPVLIIILSYILLILFGTVLLSLPAAMASGESMGFIDALFMSASSICVTGLSTLTNLGVTLSTFGKVVIGILMELGGLGFITYAIFFLVMIGGKVGIGDRMLIKEVLNLDSGKGIIKNLLTIVLITICCQIVGAIATFLIIKGSYPTLDAIGISLFHAISAFNNVGFDIFGYDNSLINFAGNIPLNIVTMLLIIVGGFGFITMQELIKKRKWKDFSLTSKIVLPSIPILILGGAIIFKIVMGGNITFLQSLSLSVSSRTAGFATIDLNSLNSAAHIVLIILMFIGGTPCSIAGGIKITTAFVILASFFQVRRGNGVNIFKRKITSDTVIRAFCLATFSIIIVAVATFMICALSGVSLTASVLEVVSAFSNTGFSLGITPTLTGVSKFIVVLVMFIGKLGPLAVMSLWNKNISGQTENGIDYPEGKIMIG